MHDLYHHGILGSDVFDLAVIFECDRLKKLVFIIGFHFEIKEGSQQKPFRNVRKYKFPKTRLIIIRQCYNINTYDVKRKGFIYSGYSGQCFQWDREFLNQELVNNAEIRS